MLCYFSVFQGFSLWENDGTGLYYYRARYYSPTLQRFISEDPTGFGGGDVDLYGYVRDNPISFVDPLGTDLWIAGPTVSEPFFHQSINVGDPRGGYSSYSFGVVDSNSNPYWTIGEVYNDTDHGGLGTVNWGYYIKTTPAEDSLIKHILDQQLGTQGRYALIGRNCRNWSQDWFNKLKERFRPESPWLKYFMGN